VHIKAIDVPNKLLSKAAKLSALRIKVYYN